MAHAASISITSRASIGWVRNLLPGGQCEHRHSLDQAHEQTERARARADHDRRAQRQRVGNRREQDALHLLAAGQVARDLRASGRAAAAPPVRSQRGTRPPRYTIRANARARGRARRSSPPRCARARRTASRRPAGAPSSGSGSRRPRRPSSARASPSPLSTSPRTSSTSAARLAGTCARAPRARARASRPSARTSCPSAHSRGTSSEPTKPLAPVTRMCICADDDARARRPAGRTLGNCGRIRLIVTGK